MKAVLQRIVFIIGVITSITVFAFILFFIYTKVVNPKSTEFSYNDGPYLFYLNDTTIKSVFIKENQKNSFAIQESILNLKDTVSLNRAINRLPEGFNPNDSFQPSSIYHFISKKIAVISDIHGSYNYFMTLLKANKIVNDSLNWNWGNGHLVIIGDVFDRGPYVTECFWLIKKLEDQAVRKGGNVHLLLGNHERLILNGNTGDVNMKYRAICEKLLINYDQLYGFDTYLGKWLRTKNAAIIINNNLFVHAGISEKIIENNFSLTDINRNFNIWARSEHLIKYDSSTREKINLLISYYGPLEYRGYFNKNIFNSGQSSNFSDELIDEILDHYSVDHIIVGHTTVKEIKGLFDNKVIAVDIGFPEDDLLDDNSDCEILIIEDSNYYKAGINGEKYLLFSE